MGLDWPTGSYTTRLAEVTKKSRQVLFRWDCLRISNCKTVDNEASQGYEAVNEAY